MPETYETGGGNKGVVRRPGVPIHEPPEGPGKPGTPRIKVSPTPSGAREAADYRPEADLVAERVMIAADRTNEIYADSVSDLTTYHAPDTTFWTAGVKNDAVMTAFTDEGLRFFASIYGGEHLAAFMGAHLLGDPVMVERNIAALQTLLEEQGQVYAPIRGPGAAATAPPEELLQQVLEDPAALEQMGLADKLAVAGIADELFKTLEQVPDTGLVDKFKRAVYVGMSGAVNVALDAEQVALLNTVRKEFGELGGLRQTGETSDALKAIGIEQVRQIGNGVIVLDQEWAEKNPDDAYAYKVWFEQNFPDKEIVIGREGIIGSLFNKLGQTVDTVSAPFGAGLHQLSEMGERVGRTPEDKRFALEQADTLERIVKEGDTYEYSKFLREYGDYISVVNPAEHSRGLTDKLSDAVVDMAGRLTRRTETGDVIEVEGDDKSWVEQAHRQIAALRDFGTDDVGMQDFKDQVFRNANPRTIGFGFADSFTRSADMLPGDPGYGAAYAASGLLANIIFDPLTYAGPIIGGIRAAKTIPKLPLTDDAVKKILGGADDLADALKMQDPSLTDAQALARATANLERNVENFRRAGAIYPQVGRGWIKNRVYRKLARYPEELAVTKPFMRASSRLYKLKQRVGDPGQFAAGLQEYGFDAQQATYLSRATSEADMNNALMNAMVGTAYRPTNFDELASELADVTRQLNADSLLDSVPGVRTLRLSPEAKGDLIVRRSFLEDTIRGRDWVKPMTQSLTSKGFRKLERIAGKPLTPYSRFTALAQDAVEKMPNEVLSRFIFEERSGRGAAAVPEAVESANRKFMISFANLYRPTGAGTALSFPSTSTYAKGLRRIDGVDTLTTEDSFHAITAMFRTFGLSNERTLALMKPWTAGELTTNSRAYHWWKETWETMVQESPILGASGKQHFSQMWDTFINERSPGWIYVDGASEPTLFRTVTNPVTQKTYKSGAPAIEADMFQTWTLPPLEDVRRYLSVLQRHMEDWSNAKGWGKKAVSSIHHSMQTGWTTVNSVWRSTTLGFRLLGALPARIWGESQIRIAGMDYASAVWHPVEWFYSTKAGTRLDDVGNLALFTDAKSAPLGVMIDKINTHPNFRLIRAGRHQVTMQDGASFYRSYSERIGRMFASPSVHNWHIPHLGNQDAALEAMQFGKNADYGAEWLAHYAELGMDPAEAVARTQQEILELIGEGPGADKVRAAIQSGRMTTPDGAVVRVGTAEFADELERMVTADGWRPGVVELARSAGDYLPTGRIPGMTAFRDFMFRNFYTRPDVALSRGPLFRQVAARHYNNLLARGYNPGTALRIAKAEAARDTADMMFTIGAKTSGEYFLRNINPFFPAYRELAATWIRRVPMRVGEGHWGLGVATIARRGDIWMDFFKEMGFVREDEQGRLFVPIPGLSGIIAWATGADTHFDVEAPLESFAGVLPVPLGLFEKDENGDYLPWHKRLQGVMPSLGGPSSVMLGLLNDIPAFKGMLDSAEDWLTMYGTDSSLGPLAVDRIAEAFGGPIPIWMTNTTREYHEAVKTWATIDGMRIAWMENPQPVWTEFDGDGDGYLTPAEEEAFGRAHKAWAELIVDRGNRYAMGLYLFKGFSGMVLPFSMQITDETKQKTTALWSLINALPEEAGGGGLGSAIIDATLTDDPNLEPYMTGKNQDFRPGFIQPGESLDEFIKAVKDGDIDIRSAADWAVFAAGMNSYSVYQSRVDALFEGQTPAEWALNFEGKQAVAEEKRKWEQYMDLMDHQSRDNRYPGQTKSFREMFEDYMEFKRIHAGEDRLLSLEQERLLDFEGYMDEFGKYFGPNYDKSDQYRKLVDGAYEALGDPATDNGKAQAWYFGEVQEGYYDQRDKLYKALDKAEPHEEAAIYDKLRRLSNRYNHGFVNPDNPDWGEFPSPEAYVFAQLGPQARDRQIAEWAKLPAEYLTDFQLEQVGYNIPEGKRGDATELINFVSENEQEFDEGVFKYHISYGSNAYEANRKAFDQAYAQKAEQLGLEDFWRQRNAPVYERLDVALNLGSRTGTWDRAVRMAESIQRDIEATPYVDGGGFYSFSGTSEAAVTRRARMHDAVAKWRKNDAEFDRIMSSLQESLGDDNPLAPDQLVDVLFFDVYQP